MVDLRPGREKALEIVKAVPPTVSEPRVFPEHEDLTSGGRSEIVPAQTIMVTRQTGKRDLIVALRAALDGASSGGERRATPNGSEG